ncbi:MAG: hypothetical protein GX605_09770 [Chloroflexi bacterium]|nr:hypothetical protein [Chloroflexota bacterium]
MSNWAKPSVDTKFQIDFDWWKKRNLNFRLDLYGQMCEECRAKYPDYKETQLVDWVDPETAEVRQVDALWQSLMTCCRNKPDYIADHTPLATAVFRVFLANGNTPLSPRELHEALGRRTPELILKTIGGRQVYLGIRPA